MFDVVPSPPSLRAIAFFLPQFHPVPENDAFWGKGFTEWRNVVQAKPRFAGHEQPHLPADLGFYDLRLAEVRDAQARMARDAGIHGFCYYHYWFAGRRLLQRPVDEILSSGRPNMPFMLCWANENWTRAWDGGVQDVLLEQTYSDADTIAHARHLAPFFADSRYIRIDDRPVFAVYNTDEIPCPNRWSDQFRQTCQSEGFSPYLIRVERHTDQDTRTPCELGFDAGLDFQPFSRNFKRWRESRPDLKDDIGGRIRNRLQHDLRRLQGWKSFDKQYDMAEFATYDSAQPTPSYPWFPGVCPSWDNTARRPKGKAIIFRNSHPDVFADWLREKSVAFQPKTDANLLFINAWNEWAEGNHLEPCLKHGSHWLDAVRAALRTPVV